MTPKKPRRSSELPPLVWERQLTPDEADRVAVRLRRAIEDANRGVGIDRGGVALLLGVSPQTIHITEARALAKIKAALELWGYDAESCLSHDKPRGGDAGRSRLRIDRDRTPPP